LKQNDILLGERVHLSEVTHVFIPKNLLVLKYNTTLCKNDTFVNNFTEIKIFKLHILYFFYAREGLDAYRDNEYSNTASSQSSHSHIADDVHPFSLSLSDLQTQTKRLSNAAAAAQARQQSGTSSHRTNEPPHIFLIDGTDDGPVITDIIHMFTLNEAQQRVFRIIAYHTLGRSKVGPQLRPGVFGEGGTGKSHLIAAVRA
jgi:hypothetical protein